MTLLKYVIKYHILKHYPELQSFPTSFTIRKSCWKITKPKGGLKYFLSQNMGLLYAK